MRVGLIVLDGWGLSEGREGNAVALARTPCFDALWEKCPHVPLEASGRAVGVRAGQMGNSEVGHLNLGAGRVIMQDIVRIDDAIADGTFFDLDAFAGAAAHVGQTGGTLHLMGLVSDGGVHSDITHLFALLELCRRQTVDDVAIHAFTDGRDTSPTGGEGYLAQLQSEIERIGTGRIATVVGRYYAMDRDRRWDRTRVAYQALTSGQADTTTRIAGEALRESYGRDVTDEFVKPIVIDGTPRVEDGDAIVFFNFRADRARQLTRAFTEADFSGFDRDPPSDLYYATMTEYDATFALPVAFAPRDLTDVAGDVWERADLTNLRIAETEKYAHVTYFFNGGREKPYRGEDRILVPSPKVATYDLQPEMSAPELTDRLIEAIESRKYDVFVCNYANADMVGHSGVLDAAILAVETVDAGLGQVVETFRRVEPEGTLIIIADHGNAETLLQPDGSPHTAHTTNPVPCILVSSETRGDLRTSGTLCDVVPTLLALQEIEQPAAMTGTDLRIP